VVDLLADVAELGKWELYSTSVLYDRSYTAYMYGLWPAHGLIRYPWSIQ